MSHGNTHTSLGDGGGSASRGASHSRSESSISHSSSNYTPTFRALHSEATSSLSSRPSAHYYVPRAWSSGLHSDSKASLSKPAVRAAESLNISNRLEKQAPAQAAKQENKAEGRAGKAIANMLSSEQSIPKLSLVDSKSRAGDKSPVSDTLSKLIPPLNVEKTPVQRTAFQPVDKNTNLFAPQVKVEDGKSEATKQVLDAGKQNTDSSNKDAEKNPAAFDKNKSISDMTYTGAIVDRTSAVLEQIKEKLAPGEVPSIKVSYTNPADQNQKQPDFLIKKDGTVEMFNNPQQTGQKEITVQFEREGDQYALTDAQKAAGANFYTYLQEQLKQQFPQAAPDAFKVEDSQGLLRDSDLPAEVKKNLDQKPEQKINPELPPNSGPTMQDTNRISRGGSSSNVPRGDIDNMTPPAQRIPNESDRMAAMKDTVASYVSRGEQKPYNYVTKRGDRGWGVGRYGMTYGQVGNWLEGLSDEEIEKLIKEGKLSPAQAANLKKMRDSVKAAKASGNDGDLHPFLKAMKNGEGSAEEMQQGVQEFLPDKVQELAASDQISKITKDLAGEVKQGENGSVDPGQVALSFVLGRNVSKEEYEGNKDYKQFVESARQAYRMQEQARMQGGPIINVENMSQVSDALNKMVGMQFWRDAAAATEYGNKGCAIAVSRALQRMGVQIGTDLSVSGLRDKMRRAGWQEVSLATAMRSGQLFVPVNKETGSHIGIGLGNQVWENSSGQRQFVTRNMGSSTLRHSGRAFIVPIAAKDQQKA